MASDKICPICKNSYKRLWKHFQTDHKDEGLSDAEFLAKFLNLNELPKCKNCGNTPSINYSHYSFRDYCNRSCQLNVNGIANWSKNNPEKSYELHRRTGIKNLGKFVKEHPGHCGFKIWAEKNTELAIENGKTQLAKWKASNPDKIGSHIAAWNKTPEAREMHRKLLLTQFRSGVSKVELRFRRKIKHLFNNFTINYNKIIGKYFPDIVIEDLKLIIEVDGNAWHDDQLEKDILRDKFLVSKGYKIRRIDSRLCDSMSINELSFMILNELIQNLPYYERIPFDQLNSWKLDIYQIGPKFMLPFIH